MRKFVSLSLTLLFTFFLSASVQLGSRCASGQEIGFLEEFVLAQDREKVLKQLVPGTEKYYYYHALHYQNKQQLDKVDEMFGPWVKRFGETSTFRQIRNRQSLLKYSDDPEATLEYLTDHLNLNFGHEREIPDAQRELPSKLDESKISIETLLERALRQRNTNELSDKGLMLLAGQKLSNTQRRHLLQRLRRPNFPNLVELIVADLKARDSRSFGSMPIHKNLTLEQLDDLAEKYPKAKTINEFVYVYMTKLHPNEDVDWRADPEEHRKYLGRLWSFVKTLNPNFNSLKACVLFRHLELDLKEGKHSRRLFNAYTKLPRSIGYVNPILVKNVESRSHIVNLSANYSSRILLSPIINDEALVRDYLHHFMKDLDDHRDFEQYIREPYLKRQFAAVKILNGIGDVEKWASKLSPEEYKRLLDRVDLEFLSTNPEFFKVDDTVELELYLKNVDNLIVKVFEINTSNYYRKYKREIDTDVKLDGLVPNFEETFEYDEAPALRKKRSFKFPQVKDRGVYVIDFIAGGKSSRALIRKGRLQVSDQVTAAGQLFTVVDQSGGEVSDANLLIGGTRYTPLKNGKILVPFSTQPGRTPAIITQGNFSCLQTIEHKGEKYKFTASLVLDRENLTRSNTARVLIRPSLQIVGGNPVPVSMLADAKLTVVSVNLDGVASTKVVEDVKLTEKEETLVEFIVPPRLKSISLHLHARMQNRSLGRQDTFNAQQAYTINTIDQSDRIQDVHLVPSDRGYFLEILGKSGEIRPKQAVRVTIKPDLFKNNVNFDLQSDEKGLIELGQLENVTSVHAALGNGSRKTFLVNTQDQTYYRTIHAVTGDTIEFPAPGGVTEATRENTSMFEVRRGTFVKDVFDKIQVNEGLVTISELDPGDYDLQLYYDSNVSGIVFRNIKIRVTDGPQNANVLVGKHRHLEARGTKTMHIARVSSNRTKIRVQMENADEYTRVHVIANRYQPAFNAYNMFARVTDFEPWIRKQSLRRSVYMEGRKIGDEYEYILRRKYAAKYPGNMLERPSLLLNPWETQTTSNNSQDAADGTEYGQVGNDADKDAGRAGSNQARNTGNTDLANLDFLGDDAVLLPNLKPNKNGVISIDRKKLGVNQHVRIVAVNAFQTIQRTVDLPLLKLKPRDSRLANALSPEKHYSQSKQIEILKKGDELTVDDIVSAKFQQYDSLDDVFQLYMTLNPSHLAKFKFVVDWEDKPEKEKRSLYSKFACHELNFFLSKKDPEFFQKVVAPHLKHKRDKTFLDLWLLGENVNEFASPWKYARLNTVERILLSQRLESQSADIIRNINEAYLETPTNRAQFDSLYDTTILGLGMDSGVTADWGIRSSGSGKQNLPKLAELQQRSAGGIIGGAEFLSGGEVAMGRGMGGMGGGGGPGGGAAGKDLAGAIVENSPARGRGGRAYYKSVPEVTSVPGVPSEPMFDDDLDALDDRFLAFDEEVESVNGKLDKKMASNKPKSRRGLSRKSQLGRLSNNNKGLELDLSGKVPVTRMRTEVKTRSVPVTRTRTETRTRTLEDGTVQTYQVSVPYTENVTQSYTVQVPVTEYVSRDYLASDFQLGESLMEKASGLYRRIPPTKEWMENNYYHLRPEQQTPQLVQVNRFWRDYSNHDGGDFFSPYFSESYRTFAEMMFALSVLDLPLKSPDHKFEYAENSMKMTADGPTVVFHQQVRDTVFDRGNTTILVSENFFQKNDRYKFEDGVRFDKFVANDFLAYTLYGSQVVITNPTSTPRAVELLIQIPLGSVPCAGAQETRTIQMNLAAFSTKTFEYSFYFPTAGDFEHYPAHVSAEEKVLAVADGTTFKVVDRPAKVDKESWEFVSQNGSKDEVLEFLNEENILRLNLNKIAFRMKDKSFFTRVIETLRNRYVYNHTLWSYAVKHNDLDSLKEYLTHAPGLVAQCGRYFKSDLLTIDPVERNWYQHKEYWPLVNARAHQLGPQRKILNPSFYAQYNSLLNVLANRRELSDDDHLVLSYYMLLQDRVEIALKQFELVSKDKLPCELQYDYCDAYLDMYREKPNDAQSKAKKWADYPVDHWRVRFENILAQIEEINGGKTKTVDEKDNSQRQTELASKAASFDFEVSGGVAKLKYQNLDEAKVNYYEMDIELLFSRSPFAQDELDGFSMIRPNVTETVALKKKDEFGKGSHEFKLSDKMQNKNVLIEVVAGDQAKSQPYFAHSLDLQLLEKYGQLHVTDEESNKAIPKTYVKVYARMHDGSVRFHKDGYTDLRGRFDYVSQSNRSIDGIEKFSILILSDEKGAVIRQAGRPLE